MQPADDYYKLLELFSSKRCVKPNEVSGELIRALDDLGLVYRGLSDEVCVKSLAELAIVAVRSGCDPKKVSNYLSWRDFENFVAEALEESGYEVFRSFRFGTRRLELDVLAVNAPSSIAIAVDCKHWSPGHVSTGRIKRVSLEHYNKLKLLLEWCGYTFSGFPVLRRVREFVGVVVTLGESARGTIEGVAVVPIYYFRDFLFNLRYYIEELNVKTLKNPCFVQK